MKGQVYFNTLLRNDHFFLPQWIQKNLWKWSQHTLVYWANKGSPDIQLDSLYNGYEKLSKKKGYGLFKTLPHFCTAKHRRNISFYNESSPKKTSLARIKSQDQLRVITRMKKMNLTWTFKKIFRVHNSISIFLLS